MWGNEEEGASFYSGVERAEGMATVVVRGASPVLEGARRGQGRIGGVMAIVTGFVAQEMELQNGRGQSASGGTVAGELGAVEHGGDQDDVRRGPVREGRVRAEVEDGGVTGALGTDGVCVHLVDASGRRMDRTSDMDASWTEACSGSLGLGRARAASVRSGMTIWQCDRD